MKILKLIQQWFSHESIGSELERYIVSHNPKDNCDVERLTEEFERRRFLQGDLRL